MHSRATTSLSILGMRARHLARMVVIAVATLALLGGVTAPAHAALDTRSVITTKEKTKRCKAGEYGYVYIHPGHMSWKSIYWKRAAQTHWSNSGWEGNNANGRLKRVMSNRGKRFVRAYLKVGKDTRLASERPRTVDWAIYCDKRKLAHSSLAFPR